MPKQFKLNLPKAVLPPSKGVYASQKLTRAQALSNLRLIQKDVAKGKAFNDPAGVTRSAVVMRQSRAEFLDAAINDILKGVDATDALCLGKGKGQAKKEERDVVIAMLIEQLHKAGYSIEQAISFAAEELKLSEETIRTSRKKGQKIATFIARINAQTESGDYRAHEPLIRLLHGTYLDTTDTDDEPVK